MYSLLLMSALAGTPDAAAFGVRRDAGCGGCTGVVVAGCYGSACYGSSCYGSCYGSSCHGGGRGLFRGGLLSRLVGRRASCHGVTACYGSSCYGSCYGSSCYGSSCYGSCYGSSCYGSCYGSGLGCGGCGGVIIGSDVPVVPVAPVAEMAPTATPAIVSPAAATPATINVELPPTAKLYVDGALTSATGAVRQFHTPALATGKAYYYEMKAEFVVDGRVEVEEKRVVVQAGATLTEAFPKLLAAAQTGNTTVAAASK